MKGTAHVSFHQGGGLIVPAQTPYERQLLFEHVEASTKRHGDVRLDWRHQHWTVSLSNGQREVCAACRRALNNQMTHRFDGRILCAWCARKGGISKVALEGDNAQNGSTNQDPDSPAAPVEEPPTPDAPARELPTPEPQEPRWLAGSANCSDASYSTRLTRGRSLGQPR